MNRRYVLTGAPGCGKTTTLEALGQRGHAVVAEAATDVIAAQQVLGVNAPWELPGFVDRVVDLQRERRLIGPESVKPDETRRVHALCATSSMGWLIHAMVGSFGGCGRRVKRVGLAV